MALRALDESVRRLETKLDLLATATATAAAAAASAPKSSVPEVAYMNASHEPCAKRISREACTSTADIGVCTDYVTDNGWREIT